ncbi:hypothetical protein SFC23_02240 [Shouchella clausii]|uniref:hypothetical protein n=1 Tax=Shouchella clausii TaxID=79880 RepID=UPI000BA5E177|nr:hypothetical protein [Shouchella clausii]PAD91047.1 hypothetical protein CHH52_16560 [Shouchella clausii]
MKLKTVFFLLIIAGCSPSSTQTFSDITKAEKAFLAETDIDEDNIIDTVTIDNEQFFFYEDQHHGIGFVNITESDGSYTIAGYSTKFDLTSETAGKVTVSGEFEGRSNTFFYALGAYTSETYMNEMIDQLGLENVKVANDQSVFYSITKIED